jgi:hypothetical protein
MADLARKVKYLARPAKPQSCEAKKLRSFAAQCSHASEVRTMEYSIRSLSSNEQVDSLAADVVARAYRAAWRVRHGDEPVGEHVLERLDLVIEFEEQVTVH